MRRVELCSLLAAFIIASVAFAASAATWHVYADGSGDAPTIKAAVAAASSNDIILVYPGTYNEHDISVTKRLEIIGVGGYENTIISALSLGRCFEFKKSTNTILLKGFTLQNANAWFDGTTGGAIICSGSSRVNIVDCHFWANWATYGGAVAVLDSSVVSFKRCIFDNNSAEQSPPYGEGGAIKLRGMNPVDYMLTVVIDSCAFSSNSSQFDGGAISLEYCDVWVMNSTFAMNESMCANRAQISLISNAGIMLENSIVAFSDGCGVVGRHDLLTTIFSCNDVYGNSWGNYGGVISDQTGLNDNISADPLFCGAPGVLTVSTTSPCTAENSGCGQAIGRFGPACGPNLFISRYQWSSSKPQPGTNITCTLKIMNTGAKNAGPFYVDYYKNVATAPPEGLHGDERRYVASLAAGDSISWTTSPVTSDVFCEWQNYFRVDTDAQVPETVEYDNLRGPHAIVWQVPIESGWPAVTAGSFHSSPVIAAIDDNPATLEIAIGCDDGKLYAWRPDGTNAPGFPVTLPAAIWSSPAVGNVSGDYRNEIVVGCDDHKLYAFDGHGTRLWAYETETPIRTTPSLADLDGDDRLEIVCAIGDHLHVFKGNGRELDGWPLKIDGIFTNPAVGDVDEDGAPEIAVVSRVSELVSYVYMLESTGALHAGSWPVMLEAVVQDGPAIGEIDNIKNGLETVVGGTNGRVYVLRQSGLIYLTSEPVIGSIESSPIIEDVDLDNALDIVVTSRIYKSDPILGWNWYELVTALTRSGAVLSGWPKTLGFSPDEAGPMPSAIALGDSADIMARWRYYIYFSLESYYGSGAQTPAFPILCMDQPIFASAAAGDVDGDGWVELFIPAGQSVLGVELRSYGYTKDDLWWPMYGHDRARTHCYGFDVPTAVEDDLAAAPKVTALGSIYPNPFNPMTKITFDTSAKGHVEIAIYDVSGRKLAVLVDRELDAGRHEALWNGKTGGGTTAASGIYFCTLRTASVSETKKLVLLR